IWIPTEPASTNMSHFMAAVNTRHGRSLNSYRELHNWSIAELSTFWQEIVEFFKISGEGFTTPALKNSQMPHASWYPSSRLNFAENVLRIAEDPSMASKTAIHHIHEDNTVENITWAGLKSRVESLAASLHERGIQQHDVVAAVLPNIPEAIIGLLATASLGAIWSINSPDMSVHATLERIS